jgi:4-amino-4-deoxychorismate lyase
LFESIKISQRKICNLPYHEDRINRTRRALLGISGPVLLSHTIQIPENMGHEVYKCRITYGEHIQSVIFVPYFPKPIKSLRLVYHDEIDYSYKYENRKILTELWDQRKNFDDVLIVKQGYITDTSYSNIVFWDGEKWITPETFLLSGTQRARLIQDGLIFPAEVKPADLKYFSQAKLINAMLDFEHTPTITTDAIL